MRKLMIAALALAGVTLVAPAGIAAAQTDDDPTVEGRGWLAAKGVGEVEIDMGGRVRMHVEGDVTITDHAGDMRFAVRGGEERAAESLDVILNDFKGGVAIRGTDFSVEVDGKVVLAAHGRGQAWLEGQGVYRTRYGDPRPWDGMVEIVGIALENVA